jgi:hypothetical protein
LTHEERVQAVVGLEFTDRQARFLVLVLRMSGVCVPRQYATFAGIAHGGKKCNAFFDKLVRRGYAVANTCLHNRARLYHLHHRALYTAIGELSSRFRRRVSARRVVERVMLLDAVLAASNLNWLTTASEKVAHFAPPAGPAPATNTSAASVEARFGTDLKCFDTFPIGIDPNGREVLLYLATTPWTDDFRSFLQGHTFLLRIASAWTLRLVFPRPVDRAYDDYQTVIREELETPLHAASINELKRYFEQRSRGAIEPLDDAASSFIERAGQTFGAALYSVLYRRWLRQGDAVLDALSSTAIADAMSAGTGTVECVVLPHSYRHLCPLVDHASSPQRVEKGERQGERMPARPQPTFSTPCSISASSSLL